MKIDPYLSFEGRCEEAIEFYKHAIGAKVTMLMRNKDCPEAPSGGAFPPEMQNKVMHASLRIGDSTLLATDGHCQGKLNFAGISLSLSAASASEAERIFAALGEGGTVTMPLAKTFFSSHFGMITDRFGISWMVIVHP